MLCAPHIFTKKTETESLYLRGGLFFLSEATVQLCMDITALYSKKKKKNIFSPVCLMENVNFWRKGTHELLKKPHKKVVYVTIRNLLRCLLCSEGGSQPVYTIFFGENTTLARRKNQLIWESARLYGNLFKTRIIHFSLRVCLLIHMQLRTRYPPFVTYSTTRDKKRLCPS